MHRMPRHIRRSNSRVNFRAGTFKRVVTDNDLRATITNGVPGTAMQPFAFGAPS